MDDLIKLLKSKGNLPNLIIVGILLVGLGTGLVLVRRQQTLTSKAYPICGLATDLRVQGLNFPTRVPARSQVNVQVQGWKDMRVYIHGNVNLSPTDGVNFNYSPDAVTPTSNQFFLLNQTETSCGGACDIHNCSNFGNECRCNGGISFTAPTQPGVYTIVANAATAPLPNNGEVCGWNGEYHVWGALSGRCYNVGFKFLEVIGAAGTPPTAQFTNPPSSGSVGQSISFSANASGQRLWGMGIFYAPQGQTQFTPIIEDLNRCNFQSTCSISGNWTPPVPGQYTIVVNAYTDSNNDNQRNGGFENCSGNVAGLPAGWADCGANSRITLTVNAAPPPTPPPPPPTPPQGGPTNCTTTPVCTGSCSVQCGTGTKSGCRFTGGSPGCTSVPTQDQPCNPTCPTGQTCGTNNQCQSPGCPTGQANPHGVCQNNSCVAVAACGVSSCTIGQSCGTQSPTPTPSGGPGVRTRALKIAESKQDLDTAEEAPYTQHGLRIPFEFTDKRAGLREIWVRFISTTGATSDQSIKLELLLPSPIITGCDINFKTNSTELVITGLNFGSPPGKGVKAGNQSLQIIRWNNEEVKARLGSVPEEESNISVTLTRDDDQIAEGICSSISQLALGAKLFCRAPSSHEQDKVDLVLAEATSSGRKIREKVKIDKEGVVQGLKAKLEVGKKYKVSIKAPKSLRRVAEFSAATGTINLPNFILPVGDIFPLDGGDGKINANDKAELNREWALQETTEVRSGDFNQDNRVNSVDWACMRYDFNAEDQPEP